MVHPLVEEEVVEEDVVVVEELMQTHHPEKQLLSEMNMDIYQFLGMMIVAPLHVMNLNPGVHLEQERNVLHQPTVMQARNSEMTRMQMISTILMLQDTKCIYLFSFAQRDDVGGVRRDPFKDF